MKSYFLIASVVVGCFAANAQVTKTTKPTPPKTATTKTPAPQLKTLSDSASYAIGVSVANFYRQQGITKLHTALVTRGINDVLGGKQPLFDENVSNMVMNRYLTQLQEQKSKAAVDSGKAFLARNKQRPGVKATASGLQYEVITEGTGIKPTATDTIVAHYRGMLLNGTEFDNSFSRGEPLQIAANRVIPGWTEALLLMSVGSKYKLYIPHNLGYGIYDNGPIPGGSTLVFEVELLDVKKAQ
ncbi:MAG TPA: FKBP-type peptidyl-prolyl cis-trans isomerase [Chitinophagaceae bacterium]|nr:FKBP-type peptidyl-prolyl cis-trans isomerase [Chitinophagaceae bacterium]